MEIRETIGVEKKFVIGMVHCLPLPGTAGYGGDVEKIYRQAVQDAKTLEESGIDAVMVENMGDGPFAVNLDTVQRVALVVATQKVQDVVKIPVGVDAAFCDYQTSLSIALVTGSQFVRIPVFVDTVEFYGGIITPCARECILYRKALGCEKIMILADIQVKHTNMLLSHVTIEQSAKNAADCGADAVIVTGSAIGTETPMEMIKRVKKAIGLPIIVGSGVNVKNINEQLSVADGAIIGSSMKEGGIISNPISGSMVKEVLGKLRR
jgi:membrane complex biogenesis BtpA family protein